MPSSLLFYGLMILGLITVHALLKTFFPESARRGLTFFSVILWAFTLKAIFLGYFLFALLIFFLAKKRDHAPLLFLRLSLFLLIGSLFFFKFFQSSGHHFLYPLGFSYFIFRLIHFVVEVYRQKIVPQKFADFFHYLIFFPTFLAGPLERYPQFSAQTEKSSNLEKEDLLLGLGRILSGVLKKFFIADALAPKIAGVLQAPSQHSWAILGAAVLGLGWQLYFDFSGYSDMAIGISRCLGIKIRENFNWPFFKHNLALHWRSWHISLHEWIRDYFFLPLFGTSWKRMDNPRARIYLGTFLSMMLFHLWHGLTANFVVMGFYHGLALTFWTWSQEYKRHSPNWRRLLCLWGFPWARAVWGLCTYLYISLGFLFFFFPLPQALSILKQLFFMS